MSVYRLHRLWAHTQRSQRWLRPLLGPFHLAHLRFSFCWERMRAEVSSDSFKRHVGELVVWTVCHVYVRRLEAGKGLKQMDSALW